MPDIRDFELLVALDRYRHFGRAADQCGISQPAFSTRIRKIEEELNLPIVRRGNRFMGFTAEGEVMLRWARKVLSDVEGMRQDIGALRDRLVGKLTMGVIPTAMPYASRVASHLRCAHPELTIEIRSLATRQIEIGLQDFSLEAGIIYFEDAEIGITEKLYDERYVLIAPRGMIDPDRDHIGWREAASLPLCLLTREMRNRQVLDKVFAGIGATPTVVMEASGFTAVLSQVHSGSAATIAPEPVAETFFSLENTVQLRLVDPEVTNAIGLSLIDHDPPLPAVTALRRAVTASR